MLCQVRLGYVMLCCISFLNAVSDYLSICTIPGKFLTCSPTTSEPQTALRPSRSPSSMKVRAHLNISCSRLHHMNNMQQNNLTHSLAQVSTCKSLWMRAYLYQCSACLVPVPSACLEWAGFLAYRIAAHSNTITLDPVESIELTLVEKTEGLQE